MNMRDFSQFALEVPVNIRGLFFDVDDTVTTKGKLTAEVITAMWQLKQANFMLIPVTGGPAGWCDHIARTWPVDGVVGENGAFYFSHDHVQQKFLRRFVMTDEERKVYQSRLRVIGEEILRHVPGAALSSNQQYREVDLAIDIGEDVPRLMYEDTQRIVAIMHSHGMTAKVSSIHVNGWFGTYDKLSTSILFLQERFGLDLVGCTDEFVFIGDSLNDQPMFRAFPYSVGVANVRDIASQLIDPPKFITSGRSGAGFIEVCKALLASRRVSS
jgi:HAD superfamily hydrolase (TIGR01484 family)